MRRASARLTTLDFTEFVLQELPPPPARVLEVGCGSEGGVVPALVAAGYDALGVDPDAPAGDRYRRADFREIEGEFDAAVAGRVLHHVHPLDPALDRLAELAPVLLVDEFACDRIDAAAQAWYEERRRALSDPSGPVSIDQWRERHPGLHPHGAVLEGLRARYDERRIEWLPYFHRWLRDDETELLERRAVEAGAIPAIGWRWAGVRRGRR
jgi:SAM-dependent methyltransferase